MSNIVAELYLFIKELGRMRSREYEESATYQGDSISLNFAVALRMEGRMEGLIDITCLYPCHRQAQ